MAELVDKEKELARLQGEQKKVQKDIDFLSKKLNNQGFVAKAPEKVIAMERDKLKAAQEKMHKILESVAALEKQFLFKQYSKSKVDIKRAMEKVPLPFFRKVAEKGKCIL